MNNTAADQSLRHSRSVELCGALVLSGVWLALQGFRFGVANNIFHIPFVLDWNALPQFADDAFYASLSNFTSALWWLLREVADETVLREQFLVIHVIGRFCATYLLIVALRGLIISPWMRVLSVLLATSTPLLRNESMIGGHGIFIDYLTHTELLWPFFIASLLYGERQRWPLAAAMAALTFSMNAFVGLWNVVALAACALLQPTRPSWREQLQSAIVFLVMTLPVVLWILQATSSDLSPQSAFSFRDYIRSYYPGHFLIEAARLSDVINLASIVLITTLLCQRYSWHYWKVVTLSLAGLFTIGIVLPYLIDARIIFNLHLLRVDGALLLCTPIMLLAALQLLNSSSLADKSQGVVILLGCFAGQLVPALLAYLAISHLSSSTRLVFTIAASGILALIYSLQPAWLIADHSFHGVSALCCVAVALSTDTQRPGAAHVSMAAALLLIILLWFCNSQISMGMGALLEALTGLLFLLACRHSRLLAVILDRLLPNRPPQRFSIASIAGLCGVMMGMQAAAAWSEHPGRRALTQKDIDWIAAVDWVREHPPATPVLIPLDPGLNIDHNFQLHAKTPVWVDWKQGAAVMWSPSFHAVWSTRYEAVKQLQTAEDFAAYARHTALDLFLLQSADGTAQNCPAETQVRWQSDHFSLCAINRRQ